MEIINKHENMQVKLLRSMIIAGEYHEAGTVVSVAKRDGREMIFHERAVPFVEQAAAPVDDNSGAADEVTANETPITSEQISDENVGGSQLISDVPAQSGVGEQTDPGAVDRDGTSQSEPAAEKSKTAPKRGGKASK